MRLIKGIIIYVKLFASLYQGTLRGRSDEILVFTNLLAHADAHGIVDKHWRAIAEETGLPRERVEAAILTLESPDSESRSPEMDGCRLVRMDEHRAWGWKIVNYGKYRAIRNEDDRKEQNRIAQEKFRNKNKPKISEVSKSKQSKPPSAQEEEEAEAEEVKAIASGDAGKPSCPHKEIIALYHEILPSAVGVRDWTPARAALLKARWNEDIDRQNLEWWKGLFEFISKNDFLMGRTSSSGRKPFNFSLPWLLKAENFAKVREGYYE